MEIPSPMTCPKCHSSDLKKISLIYAEGVHVTRGGSVGWVLGSGVWFAGHWGKSESRLSAMLHPPGKFPNGLPIVLWLVGFFVVMAFAGRGSLSWIMGLLSVAYISLLPSYLLAALCFNFVLRPRKYRRWESTMMCRCCGTLVEPHAPAINRLGVKTDSIRYVK
jgi:hypothetical protein